MGLKVRQNNQWKDMSQGVQWKQNNEWKSHGSVGYPSYYMLVHRDWMMSNYGLINYMGTDEYIVIPDKDEYGEIPTFMAQLQSPLGIPNDFIKGVATGDTLLQSTDYMFMFQKAQNTVELDYFYTPDVQVMEGMFSSSEYTHLDLRSFDTNNCYNFGYMFYDAYNLKTVDLSSFDILTPDDSPYPDDVSDMFGYSAVETVYVKDTKTANYLRQYGGKEDINFIVGSST